MAHMVFDTETTGLDKPFCYDVGYAIYDDDGLELARRHFVIEQVWHNLPLFESAYYHEKRPLYVNLMRSKKAIMDKWGYVMLAMKRDIREYNVTAAYAYNADFDDKVFTFNCDWFKTGNPLENIPIFDIWGYVSQFITNTKEYQAFCEANQYFTDTVEPAEFGLYRFAYSVTNILPGNFPTFARAYIGNEYTDTAKQNINIVSGHQYVLTLDCKSFSLSFKEGPMTN